ncbi:MAG: AmmeMemoRadiSam system protein A [Deltaproteobacteria bacterium]|nr:AmmeMemoRadiSam system protein A [Deltaproteobacteria bacterium]
MDIVIELDDAPGRIVMIERGNEPRGWALPGGFVDYGECVEDAARREAEEETGLDVSLLALLGVYSSPDRDPRLHTISTVFVGRASGLPKGGDDATHAVAVDPAVPPRPIVFDHPVMLADYLRWRRDRAPREPIAGRWLGAAERAKLVGIARAAAEACARHSALPEIDAVLPPRLAQHAGCFVTLHVGGALRGCIGSVTSDRPLAELVREMAVAAATRDSRFPPLRGEELGALTVDVSVLAPPWRASPDDLIVGRHGVVLSLGGRRGLLLPQVATEHGFDRLQLLEAVSRKAGLREGAWQHPDAELELFTAQVF